MLNSRVALLICASLVALDCQDVIPPEKERCDVYQDYTPGTNITGFLEINDCLWEDGTFIDRYRIIVTETTVFLFNLTSVQFEAFLIITDPENGIVAYSGNGGPLGNPRLEVQLQPGTYFVLVNTFADGDTGEYILSSTTRF